jgi:1-phosphofructokinase family hexose kinase
VAGSRVILTVTLNAALDVTYQVPELVPGATHRVQPYARAGGKGVNVARVLRALGHEPVATGFAGGETGRVIREDLIASGIPEAFVEPSTSARRTVTIVSEQDGTATAFNEPGLPLSIDDWKQFVTTYHELAAQADVVVLSGSLPPRLPYNAYARLIRATATPTILDTSGAPLLEGTTAGPQVIKPNEDEMGVTGLSDPLAAAKQLRERGAGVVVATMGAGGMLAVTGNGVWRAKSPEPVHGNPTGAGDACVAALAAGLASGTPWPELLVHAVALSASAVAGPLAGDIDLATYQRLWPSISVEELDAHHDR